MPLLRKCFLPVFAIAIGTLESAASASVELGIDVLPKEGFGILREKRVGFVTNLTGIDSDGVRARLIHGAQANRFSKPVDLFYQRDGARSPYLLYP